MKFSVTKEKLLEGLQKIQNIVSTRTTLPILSNVLLETLDAGLQLSCTDMDVALRCQIPAQVEIPGAMTLPARRLLSIVRELPAGEIQIEGNNRQIATLQIGQSYFKIYGLAKEEFPEFPSSHEAHTFTLPQALLKEGLRKTSYAISMDEARYVLNGILFSFHNNQFRLVATDGRRLAQFEKTLTLNTPESSATAVEEETRDSLETNQTALTPQSTDSSHPLPQSLPPSVPTEPLPPLDFIVPTKAIQELQRLLGDGEIEISVGPQRIVFLFKDALLISKRVEGNYPNYKQVIPVLDKFKECVILDREAFLTCVRRVSLLSSDQTHSIRLTFSEHTIEVASNTPEVGEARESLTVAYSGTPFSIAFNSAYLMDPLKNLPNDEVHLHLIDDISPGVLEVDSWGFLYVLMPMRVSAADERIS